MSEAAAWPWAEDASGAAGTTDEGADDRELALAFARCFGDADGRRVLAHLRAITIERRSLPAAGEAELRHLEGQRFLVAYVAAMAARGRG